MTRTIGVISAMLLAGLSAYCFITYLKTTGYTPTFALVTFAVGALYGILTGLNEGINKMFSIKQFFIYKLLTYFSIAYNKIYFRDSLKNFNSIHTF